MCSALNLFRATPIQGVADWACENRMMGVGVTATPGLYSYERVPYAKLIMDWMSPSDPTEVIYLQWGAQTGKTTLIENCIGHRIHQAPCPILLVRPTIDSAKEWSKVRLQNMIAETAALRGLITEPKHRGDEANNVILQKFFPGGSLDIVGANAPTGLSAKSICLLIMDERDRFPGSAGDEGDPGELAIKRTTAYKGQRKIIVTSTPTIKDESRVEEGFLKTDQCYYFVPCPRCGKEQRLFWTHPETREVCVVWPRGEPWKAVYRCPYCAGTWKNAEKNDILPAGAWQATAVGRPAWHGAHLSTLYAPVGWDDFATLAQEWEDCHPAGATNREALIVFVNTRLAETWEDRYDTALDVEELFRRCEPMPLLPNAAAWITGAVDVQANRLELELCCWGPGLESWGFRYEVFWGDTDKPQVWEDLHRFIHFQPWKTMAGDRLAIVGVAIDTGYATTEVYEFIQAHKGWGYFPVKGEAGLERVIIDPRPHVSAAKFGGLPFVMIGTDEAKRQVYSALRLKDPGPRYCHFAADAGYTLDVFKGMTVERMTKRPDATGHLKVKWVKPSGKRNEPLDIRVYNLAMATIFAKRNDLTKPLLWTPIELGAQSPATSPNLAYSRVQVKTENETGYQFDRSAFLR